MFQMMGVFAEFERAMIQERVRAGLRRAKETGAKSGKAAGRNAVRFRRKRRTGRG
jgi:DNA invertase Pin-like site-specific DNA recombinase